MVRRILLVTLALAALLPLSAQANRDTKATDIQKVLNAQVAAWNRGDLDGYMAGYWRSAELEFYGGDTITKGFDETLARYKERYQSGGREMGHLDFSELTIHTNPSDTAWASGRWHLKMKDGSERKGLFTIILRKTRDGWKIVHDHSS